MGDSNTAAKTVAKTTSSAQPGVFKRLLELMMMLVSAFLVIFSWNSALKAQEESAELRSELRRARTDQADRSGTRCVVCLDNPREALLQPCGHVCVCQDCIKRIVLADNKCPVCRILVSSVQKAFIS